MGSNSTLTSDCEAFFVNPYINKKCLKNSNFKTSFDLQCIHEWTKLSGLKTRVNWELLNISNKILGSFPLLYSFSCLMDTTNTWIKILFVEIMRKYFKTKISLLFLFGFAFGLPHESDS